MKRKNGNIYCGDLIKQKMEGVGIFMWTDKKRYIDELLAQGILSFINSKNKGIFEEVLY